jgi:hypothetical protein
VTAVVGAGNAGSSSEWARFAVPGAIIPFINPTLPTFRWVPPTTSTTVVLY